MQNERLILIMSLLALLIILIVAGGYYAFFANDREEEGEPVREETQEFIESNSVMLESAASHNTREDCWVAYGDYIYDISEFVGVVEGLEIKDCGTKIEKELDGDVLRLMQIYQIADLRT